MLRGKLSNVGGLRKWREKEDEMTGRIKGNQLLPSEKTHLTAFLNLKTKYRRSTYLSESWGRRKTVIALFFTSSWNLPLKIMGSLLEADNISSRRSLLEIKENMKCLKHNMLCCVLPKKSLQECAKQYLTSLCQAPSKCTWRKYTVWRTHSHTTSSLFLFIHPQHSQIQIVFVGSCPVDSWAGGYQWIQYKVGAPQEWALQNWGGERRAREQNQD